MQDLLLIVIVFFLVILIVPYKIKLHVSYNLLDNLGALSFYIFFIKVLAYKVTIKNKNIVLISEKKEKIIEKEVSQKQMRFLEQLLIQLKQKVVVKKIYLFSRIGIKNAMQSAILTGLFNSIFCSLLAYIKNTKKSAQIGSFCEPLYNDNCFTIGAYIAVSITIVDVLYALIMSLILIKRSEKYERI